MIEYSEKGRNYAFLKSAFAMLTFQNLGRTQIFQGICIIAIIVFPSHCKADADEEHFARLYGSQYESHFRFVSVYQFSFSTLILQTATIPREYGKA